MTDVKKSWKAIQLPFEQITALSDERRCYQLSERTVAMLLSQTPYLYWHTRWDKEGDLSDADKLLVRQLAASAEHELLNQDACATCNDYYPSSSLITWEPQNPFTEPELVPGDEYNYPPFYVVDETSVQTVLGAQLGDVLTDITRLSANPLDWGGFATRGFPRLRVTWTGAAEVELHLLNIPQGGLALITIDDLPQPYVAFLNSISVLSYNSLLEILAQTFGVLVENERFIGEEIIEFEVTGDVEHHVDVTFLPQVSEEVLIGFGGGLRKVTICGFPPDECPDCGSECPDGTVPACVRYNEEDDQFENSYDGGETWHPDDGADPRHINWTDPLTTADPACDAAARIAGALEALINQIILAIQGGALAADIGALIILVIALFVASAALFTLLLILAVAYAAGRISAGYIDLHDAFEFFDWHSLACIINC